VEARLHGCPQDTEWAPDADRTLFLLQSRPVTSICPITII